MSGDESQANTSSAKDAATGTSQGDGKSPADQLVELLLYAPVGLLYEYQNVLDQVVKRGRSQVQLAKVMGKMAAQRGQSDVEENVGDVLNSAAETVAKGITELGAAIGLAPPKAESTEPETGADNLESKPVESKPVESKPVETEQTAEDEPAAERQLPIAGYDSLKAKEIISLLPDLDRDQRARIKDHEQTNRNRKTVLARLDSLEK